MGLRHHLPEIDVFIDLLDLPSVDNYIIFVAMLVAHYFSLPQMHLTGFLMSWVSWSISCSFEVALVMRTISRTKIRWDKYSPSILTPLFSQLILLMMAYCRHDVNGLGEMLFPCLAPLPSLHFSLSLWCRRTDVTLL